MDKRLAGSGCRNEMKKKNMFNVITKMGQFEK